MSSPLILGNAPLGKLVPALGPLMVGAIFAFFAPKVFSMGTSAGRMVTFMALALGFLGLGLVLGRGAFDRTVQVVLNEAGFRDRRGGDVLVTWDQVALVIPLSSFGGGSGVIHFELTGPVPEAVQLAPSNLMNSILPFGKRTIRMEISSLDTTEQEVLEAIRRLGPEVKVG
jgi:hypothetical protein